MSKTHKKLALIFDLRNGIICVLIINGRIVIMKRIISLLIALIVLFSISTVAMAVDSPVATTQHACELTNDNANAGSVKKEVTATDTYTLTATAVTGYKFAGWTISGNYTIVSGSLTSEVIVVKVTGDIKANATFSVSGLSGDGSTSAPETGDHMGIVLFICALSLAGVGVATKKVIA